jgi:hypothetical protein
MKHFFAFLLLFIISYYLIKAIIRLLSIFAKRKIEEKSFFSSGKSGHSDVTIETPDTSKKRFSKDSGEYIDFEEVK